jgi:hypothetical protein
MFSPSPIIFNVTEIMMTLQSSYAFHCWPLPTPQMTHELARSISLFLLIVKFRLQKRKDVLLFTADAPHRDSFMLLRLAMIQKAAAVLV